MPGKTISRNLSVVLAAHAFLFTLAISAAAQTTVPATARQAASMPAFQSRLARPTTSHMLKRTPLAGSSFSARRPLNDGDLYDNGPVNGQIDAWTIDFGYQVTNSVVASSQATGIQFWAWLIPGDTITNIEVSVGSSPFGTDLFDAFVNVTASNCFGNSFGYNVCLESGNFTGPTLYGSAWLTLQNAILPSGDPVYWDENSGVGCQSPGCPSQAQANTVGTIPSEAFTLLGASTTTTTGPDCSHGSALEEIHDFTGGADGANPVGLAMDHAGNFYGTTQSGGSAGAGTAFKLSPTDAGSGWALTPVYEFSGRAAGGNPGLPLTAPNGTLFSALGGGLGNCSGQYCGQIIKLMPPPTACASVICSWRDTVLYQFAGGTDGTGNVTAMDAEGNLYGSQSGGDYGQGGVFELTPSLGYWTKTVLYSFTGGDDGGNPGAVLLGSDGNLYGRAAGGGAYGAGVLYQLAHSQGGWTENTLLALPHSQSWIPEFPNLVSDGTGNTFYFVTSDYRTGQYGWYIDAVISEMTQVDGQWSFAQVGYIPPTTWDSYVQLYDLSAAPSGCIYAVADAYCDDCYPTQFLFNKFWGCSVIDLGEDFHPMGPIVLDQLQNYYGVTNTCGAYGKGTVWKAHGW